jgi:hypothetical protein
VARRRRSQRRVLVISYIVERTPIYPSESSYILHTKHSRQASTNIHNFSPFYDFFASARQSIRHDIVKTSASVLTRRSSATATFKMDLRAQHHIAERGIPKEPNAVYLTIPRRCPSPVPKTAQHGHPTPRPDQTLCLQAFPSILLSPHNSSWRSADPAWQGRRGLMYCLLCRKADRMCGLARIRYISHVP